MELGLFHGHDLCLEAVANNWSAQDVVLQPVALGNTMGREKSVHVSKAAKGNLATV